MAQLLTTVDADEVSPVLRAANRKRFVLKEDGEVEMETEIADIMAVPWEREGAMIDELRKEAADESVVKAAVGAMRLLAGIADELPDGMREAVEKLGSEIYTRTNPPLNTTAVSSPTDLSGSSYGAAKDGSASGAAKDGHGRDAELSGTNSAPKVAADDGDEDEDDVAKAMYDEEMEKAERTFSPGARRGYAKRGVAMPDGSFPIPDADALRRAKMAVGRANPSKRSAVRAHINSRAKALGLPGLGESAVSKEDEEILELAAHDNRLLAWVQKAMRRKPKTQDSGEEPDDQEPDDDPDDTSEAVEKGGTVETHAVPIKKEDGSWDLSGVPEASRPFYTEMIEKADRLAKTETELAETREELRTTKIIEKAETQFKAVGARDDIVAVLKEAGDKLSTEGYESLVSLLSAANERIETGDLFKEAGYTGGAAGEGTDAWAKIEKAAEALVEKSDTAISKAQAVDRVLATPEGAALYSAYMRETGLGVS